MSGIQELLVRNAGFAAKGGHEGLTPMPTKMVFLVCCIDSRIDPAYFLGVELGDALVMRNAGGRVNSEVINEIAFIASVTEAMSGEDAPGFEVAVVHHTGCGTGFLADPEFRASYAKRISVDEKQLVDVAVIDPELSVVVDVNKVLEAAAIPQRVTVSGHVYDVDTGLVTTVMPAA